MSNSHVQPVFASCPHCDELATALKNLIAASGHIPVFGGIGPTVKGIRLAMKYIEAFEKAEAVLKRITA
jgi:hypothetical protein